MQIEADIRCADWIGPRLARFGGSVGAVVPTGFEAYARVLHPVMLSQGGGMLSWAEVAQRTGRQLHARAQFWRIAGRTAIDAVQSGWREGAPRAGELDRATQTELIATLAKQDARGVERECIAAVWYGRGDLRSLPELERAPRLQLPHREYVLFRGALGEVPELGTTEPKQLGHFTPALLWAADASWCVATEVDFDSTLVGGPRSLIDAVLANKQLEAFEVQAADSLAWDGDRLNGTATSS